jgi:hypothetical protein
LGQVETMLTRASVSLKSSTQLLLLMLPPWKSSVIFLPLTGHSEMAVSPEKRDGEGYPLIICFKKGRMTTASVLLS